MNLGDCDNCGKPLEDYAFGDIAFGQNAFCSAECTKTFFPYKVGQSIDAPHFKSKCKITHISNDRLKLIAEDNDYVYCFDIQNLRKLVCTQTINKGKAEVVLKTGEPDKSKGNKY
jgi:hypothetical protein